MAKPHKVEEPAAPYLTTPKQTPTGPASKAPAARLASSKDVRKINAQLMQTHRKVLQKLAQ